MSVEDAMKDTLTYLFEEYEKNPNAIYSIKQIAEKHKIDQHELGELLLESGWIRNQQLQPTDFICQITLEGIEEVDPDYVQDKVNQIVQTLGELGRSDIVEILGYKPENYQKAMDLAKLLETKNLIQDTQYFFPGNNIITELSLWGRKYVEEKGPGWR